MSFLYRADWWPLMRLYDTNEHLRIIFESVEFSKTFPEWNSRSDLYAKTKLKTALCEIKIWHSVVAFASNLFWRACFLHVRFKIKMCASITMLIINSLHFAMMHIRPVLKFVLMVTAHSLDSTSKKTQFDWYLTWYGLFNIWNIINRISYMIYHMWYSISHVLTQNPQKTTVIQHQKLHYEFYLFLFSYNEEINLTKDSESMENSVSMNWKSKNSESMNWETENSHQKSQSMSFRGILQGFTERWVWFFSANFLCFCFCILGESLSYSSVKAGSHFEESFTKFKSWMISADTQDLIPLVWSVMTFELSEMGSKLMPNLYEYTNFLEPCLSIRSRRSFLIMRCRLSIRRWRSRLLLLIRLRNLSRRIILLILIRLLALRRRR